MTSRRAAGLGASDPLADVTQLPPFVKEVAAEISDG